MPDLSPIQEKAMGNTPIPGESLTGELGALPFEQPPEYPSVEENIAFYASSIINEEVMPQIANLLSGKRAVADLAEGLVTSGVANGRHTVDVAVLIVPIVMELLAYVGELYEIEYVMGDEIEDEDDRDALIDSILSEMGQTPGALEVGEEDDEYYDEDDDDLLMELDDYEEMPPEPAGGLMSRPVVADDGEL